MAVPATFPAFSILPPELRLQIWRYSLPHTDDPAVYFFKRGCWCQRQLLPTEKGYDASDPFNWTLEFREELLEKIRVKMPHSLVNHEARNAVLDWVREQEFETSTVDGKTLFLRPIYPEQDVMCVRPEDVWDFRLEQAERLLQPDLRFHSVTIPGAQVRSMAISEATLRDTAVIIREIHQFFACVNVIYVIPDMGPEIRTEDTTQIRWEVETDSDVRYTWDAAIQRFCWDKPQKMIGRALIYLIENRCNIARESLTAPLVQAFQVQIATISRT